MLALCCASGQLACNALDDPSQTQNLRIVPTDTRPALQLDIPPPPLSGGTLTVARDGRFAAVADEARDRVSMVDLASRSRVGDVSLPGSRPGRVVEGEAGTFFVVLRDAGAIAQIRSSDATLLARHEVCSAPRGLAYDEVSDRLHVACASGRFVTLSPAGEVLRSVRLPNDLRDVVVERGNVWVSRFRSAEVLRLDADGNVAERLQAPPVTLARTDDSRLARNLELFEARVGWRLAPNPAGGVVLVHQRATTAEIDLSLPEDGGMPYGGGGSAFGCSSGIQRSALTAFDSGGRITAGSNVGVTLPVDIALSPEGRAYVVGAGREDFDAPRSTFVSIQSGGEGFSSGTFGPSSDAGAIVAFDVATAKEPERCHEDGRRGEAVLGGPEQYVVAVATHPLVSGSYLVQTREPAQLVIMDDRGNVTPIALGGASVADTGFDLFHRNAEAGISCASCHPDGTDDGHVWSFKGQGLRSTQPLDVGLAGTDPFHWDGSLPEVGELMGEVFVSRMGGVHESPARLGALERWLFALRAPLPEAPADVRQVDRGRSLFESLELGCADCHRGERFTDNNNYDVGTGEPGERFQVPSLIGVGTRSRLIHTGCAGSLRERFELDCAGGDQHGKVSRLVEQDIDDLVAYLETL
jgi:DNA-binding beta-propeller fold protein YncE